MKTSSISLVSNRSIDSVLKLLAVTFLVVVSVAPRPAMGQIIAEFSGGVSTSVVDAWTGSAGDGWSNDWQRGWTGNFPEFAVPTEDDPTWVSLDGDKNYLRSSFKSDEEDTGHTVIARQYTNFGNVNLADPQVVSFFYRVHQGTTASINNINIGDLNVLSNGPWSAVTTWRIGVDASDSTWRFGNGTDGVGSFWLDSNMTVSVGDIYFFQITIDPASYTYNAYVENITGDTSFSSDDLAFRTNKEVGGYLNLYSSVAQGDPNFIFDLTSLEVAVMIPEPSTALLVFGAGLALFARRSLRRI